MEGRSELVQGAAEAILTELALQSLQHAERLLDPLCEVRNGGDRSKRASMAWATTG